MDTRRISAAAFAIGAGALVQVCGAQPVIRDLGTLGGTTSYGNAISADGRVVVGSASMAGDAGTRAFRWTLAGGMQAVGGLMNGGNSYGTSVSGDGQVVAGFAPAPGPTIHGFRWSVASGVGMEECGTLGGKDSLALALNGDGSMAGGIASLETGGRGHACIWSDNQRIQDLGALGGVESKIYGMSSDGAVAVGTTDIAGSSSTTRAFRWTESGGMVELGTFGGANSRGFAISADGSTIVGFAESTVGGGGSGGPGAGNGGRAFRWTESTGMQSLGTIGGAASAAYAVSADGTIVAGYDTMPLLGTSHAFIWSATRGMADLNTLLPSLGCNLAGWTLIGVNGMSADGTAVTGNGIRNGAMRAFVITGLPPGGGSCRADFDGSGGLAVLDIFAFLNSWFVGEPRADFDGSGAVAEQDIHAFLNAWFAGCGG